jgi:hypothetical protein
MGVHQPSLTPFEQLPTALLWSYDGQALTEGQSACRRLVRHLVSHSLGDGGSSKNVKP